MTVWIVYAPAHPYVQIQGVWSTWEAAKIQQDRYNETFGLWRGGICVAEGAFVVKSEVDAALF